MSSVSALASAVPPATPALNAKPFAVLSKKLSYLDSLLRASLQQSSSLSSSSPSSSYPVCSHHLLFDCCRLLEDYLISAALIYLNSQPHDGLGIQTLMSSSFAGTLTALNERIRDAELLDPKQLLRVDQIRQLAKWAIMSASRHVNEDRLQEAVNSVRQMDEYFTKNYENAQKNSVTPGCPYHVYCREMPPLHSSHLRSTGYSTHRSVAFSSASSLSSSASFNLSARTHASLPYDLTVEEFHARCAPLPNTESLNIAEVERTLAEEDRVAEQKRREREERKKKKDRLKELQEERKRQKREQKEKQKEDARNREQKKVSVPPTKTKKKKPAEWSDGEDNEDADTADKKRESDEAKKAQAIDEEILRLQEHLSTDPDESSISESSSVGAPLSAASRLPFAFHCIVCHLVLLPGKDIDRIERNQVWTKKGRSGKKVSRNEADRWESRKADVDEGEQDKKMEEGEEDNEEEEEENDGGEAGAEDDGFASVNLDGSLLQSNDEQEMDRLLGKSGRKEVSIGCYCVGCNSYIGRYFPSRDATRFIYIHRVTGQNYMWWTGRIDKWIELVKPKLSRRDEGQEEEEEDEQQRREEEENDEEEEITKKKKEEADQLKRLQPVPVIVGVPTSYVSVSQALLYPYPRFGPASPYSLQNRPPGTASTLSKENLPAIGFFTAADKGASVKAEDGWAASLFTNVVVESSAGRPVSAPASLYSTQQSLLSSTVDFSSSSLASSHFRPPSDSRKSSRHSPSLDSPALLLPVHGVSLPSVVSALKAKPDPLYSLRASPVPLSASTDSAEVESDPLNSDGDAFAENDVGLLLLTDRSFVHRRAFDTLVYRLHSLFSLFPGHSVYANVQRPPVPLFTDFFVKTADFSLCRGTARYVFHFLTKKDDSKMRRRKYSMKKLMGFMQQKKYTYSAFHLAIGGYGGHRLILVKIGDALRIFQSNACIEQKEKRYTLVDWIESENRWSRTLSVSEWKEFFLKFEEAVRGKKEVWQELFCRNETAQTLYDIPMDVWTPKDVQFCVAKIDPEILRA